MLKTAILILSGLIVLSISTQPVSANVSTKINSSTTGGDAYSSVSVTNDVNGGTSQTDIKMETNGEVKEYHGTGSNIYLESKVEGETVPPAGSSPTSPKPTTSVTTPPSSSPSATPDEFPTFPPFLIIDRESFDVFERLKSFFENFFKI